MCGEAEDLHSDLQDGGGGHFVTKEMANASRLGDRPATCAARRCQDGENQSGARASSSLNQCGPCPSNCIPARGASRDQRPDTRPIEAPRCKRSRKNPCKAGGIHTRPAPIGTADLEAALGKVNRQNPPHQSNRSHPISPAGLDSLPLPRSFKPRCQDGSIPRCFRLLSSDMLAAV